jgi:hypothetical protein
MSICLPIIANPTAWLFLFKPKPVDALRTILELQKILWYSKSDCPNNNYHLAERLPIQYQDTRWQNQAVVQLLMCELLTY